MTVVLSHKFLDGDFLEPKEAMEKYRVTKIEPLHDRYRLFDHDSFKDFERRRGEVLHSSDFICRLIRIYPCMIVQHQINYPDDWGLYCDVMGKLTYLSAVHQGWLTEFSYSLVDERDLPIEERRGWRTVLLRLMAKGILSWDDVTAEFGASDGLNSDRWQMYSAPYRNYNSARGIEQNLANEMETF